MAELPLAVVIIVSGGFRRLSPKKDESLEGLEVARRLLLLDVKSSEAWVLLEPAVAVVAEVVDGVPFPEDTVVGRGENTLGVKLKLDVLNGRLLVPLLDSLVVAVAIDGVIAAVAVS
jgi:hypothetical protein